jgi:hypothetical protein
MTRKVFYVEELLVFNVGVETLFILIGSDCCPYPVVASVCGRNTGKLWTPKQSNITSQSR